MTDPIYEVKIKDESVDPQTSGITQSRLEARASEIAAAKVEELKNALIGSISQKESRYGENGPKTWDELHDSIERDSVAKAEQRSREIIKEELAAQNKAREELQRAESERNESQRKEELGRLTAEWQDLVADGVVPDLSDSVRAKLKEGKVFSELTPEEQKDPGLKTYNELIATHMKMKQEGKSNSLYRTAQKFLNQKPSGADAPVFGGTSPTNSNSEDYDYEDVSKNRKARFGF